MTLTFGQKFFLSSNANTEFFSFNGLICSFILDSKISLNGMQLFLFLSHNVTGFRSLHIGHRLNFWYKQTWKLINISSACYTLVHLYASSSPNIVLKARQLIIYYIFLNLCKIITLSGITSP